MFFCGGTLVPVEIVSPVAFPLLFPLVEGNEKTTLREAGDWNWLNRSSIHPIP